MITTILTSILTTGLLFTSSVMPPTTVPADTAARYTFTQVLPANNFVAYTIQKGETLEQIAHAKYGDAAYWTTLWNDNAWVEDPNDLTEGLLLQLRTKKPASPDALITKLTTPTEEEPVVEEVVAVKPEIVAPAGVPTSVPTATVAVSAPPAVAATPTALEEVYKQAGDKYGIPWQILYGLHITETGGRDGAISNHGGSGAQGPMQFMPGTWRAYGVDGNGDGAADINNAVDAIHGAANYLAKHGSLDQGLRSYGGNYNGTLNHAREKGYSL